MADIQKSLELRQYRQFSAFRLQSLARVNLFVGLNNCGKSSLLEAIYVQAMGGDPTALLRIARMRGEMAIANETRNWQPTISHFFTGHTIQPGSAFSIHSNDPAKSVTASVKTASDFDMPKQFRLFADGETAAELFLVVTRGADDPSRVAAPHAVPISNTGVVLTAAQSPRLHQPRFFRPSRETERGPSEVEFITPDSLDPRSMSEIWDQVLLAGREAEVIEGMRVLEPDIDNIFFLSNYSSVRTGGRGGILVSFSGTQQRVPLGSLGDGMRRLLALSSALVSTANGVLLVDEIDTGLHYSLHGDVWKLIVTMAQRANVQVFATTHSLDCVRGLAWLCKNHPELRDHVALHRIDPQLDHAVTFDADEIEIAVDQDIEVRG